MNKPDVVVILTDQERAAPSYESEELKAWRRKALPANRWFEQNAVSFAHHYTGSLACVPSRPTIFTGQYPWVHGVTQTDGLGKNADDSAMNWLEQGTLPTLGNWFRKAGYDTYYDGKWHISHAELIDEKTGKPLASNDENGVPDPAAVERYKEADLLHAFGFSGWIGPEPHGALPGNSGLKRDPLIAERVSNWLADRYERRAEGDVGANRPFFLVASFVNPHDIVFLPAWMNGDNPVKPSDMDPPPVAPSPTDDEDLSTKPSAQSSFRDSYYSGYGPEAAIRPAYEGHAQEYRDLYYRLHAEAEASVDRVRRAVTDQAVGAAGSVGDTLIVRTADHGEMLGSHGGMHQKWFTLYDEATRVPFYLARVGEESNVARRYDEGPTSHVDIAPTLLEFAGIDYRELSRDADSSFGDPYDFPGKSLIAALGGKSLERGPVYMMTVDHILEGDTGMSILGRLSGSTDDAMAIRLPADCGSGFEAVVTRVSNDEVPGAGDHVYKLGRCFDDPELWSEPGVRQRVGLANGGEEYRTVVLEDEWELYDLTADPIETVNLASDPDFAELFEHLKSVLSNQRDAAATPPMLV